MPTRDDAYPTLCCPLCKGELEARADAYRCPACERTYPVVLGIPDFRVFPDPYISIENDHGKGRFLAANAEHIGFADLVRFYWSITPDAPDDMAERFTRKAVLLADKWEEALPDLEADLPATPDTVLEVGCGTGGFLAAAARRGRRVVGVDIAFRWLVVAKKRMEEAGLDVPLVCACAEYLPFREEQFDLVFAEATLEHVRDQAAMLAECRRVGRSGGSLSLLTANRLSIAAEPHVGVWGVGFLPRRWMPAYVRLVKGVPYRFLRLVSRFELARLLRRAGFGRPRFALPEPTRAEVEALSDGERRQVELYLTLKRAPLTGRLLRIVGPVLGVTSRIGTG